MACLYDSERDVIYFEILRNLIIKNEKIYFHQNKADFEYDADHICDLYRGSFDCDLYQSSNRQQKYAKIRT